MHHPVFGDASSPLFPVIPLTNDRTRVSNMYPATAPCPTTSATGIHSGVVNNDVKFVTPYFPSPSGLLLDARKAYSCGIFKRKPAAGVYRSLRKSSLPSTRAHRTAQWTFIGTVPLMLTMLGEHVRRHDADNFYRRIWGISTSAFCHNPPRGRVVVLHVYG